MNRQKPEKKKKVTDVPQPGQSLGEKVFAYDSKFARFMNALGDVLCIGILWLVTSVPLVTVGASSTAAYYAMAKCVHYKAGRPVGEFFRSFRANFRQTLPATILLDLAVVTLIFDLIYLWGNETPTNDAIFMVLLLILFLMAGLMSYLWPLLSRFDKRNAELLKLGFFLCFKYLPITIGILAVFILGCFGIYLMPWAILVIPGAFLYGLTFPMEWVLHKLMPPAAEAGEEAEKWYYR